MSTVEPGATLVERYRLIRPTTSDLAMTTAWEAVDEILDKPVRVTFVGGAYAADGLDSARRAALVADPRLARVLDVGTDPAYVVTEPFAGVTLTQIVASGLVDGQQARALVGEAASALSAAHRRGVHHTALRPECVRVDGHRVVVTGLGLDAGLASGETLNGLPALLDAHGLVALLYYAMTARWPGIELEGTQWVAKDVSPPLPAQRGDDGAIVPLSALVPHVDPALDDLVNRTFDASWGASGPATPDDVITALAPWGEVSVVASLPGFVQPNPEDPQRHSVAQAFGSEGVPPVRRPVTGRIARNPGTDAQPAANGAGQPSGYPQGYPQEGYQYQPEQYPQTSGHAPVPPPPPGEPQQPAQQYAGYPPAQQYPQGYDPNAYAQGYPQGYDQAGYAQAGYDPNAYAQGYQDPNGFQTQPAPKRGVNPTPIVLSLVGVAVVAGLFWAITNALGGSESPVGEAPPAASAPAPGADPSAAASPGATDGSASAPPAPTVRPIIASGERVDPLGDQAKPDADRQHPEAAPRAYDADPSTFWFTQSYKRADFGGFQAGVGYVIHLQEPAPVNKIQLLTNSTGGHVQVRLTTAEDPAGGQVLAEGAFATTTDLVFTEQVVSDTFVLWITELPESPSDSDLKFRLELNEIALT